MKAYLPIICLASLLGITLALVPSCEKVYTDPSAIGETDALSSADGLIALGVGIQRRYSIGRQSLVYNRTTAAGFTTNELRLINPGNVSENDLSLGYGDLDADNAVVNNLWSQSFLIRKEAQQVLDNLENISNPSVRSGLRAYATIFSALANETLYLFFEQAPLESSQDAMFSDRSALLQSNLMLLDEADRALAANPPTASFLSRVPSGIDLRNTIKALQARHNLFLGNYAAAITAADAVDESATSVLQYDDVTPNPIAFVSITTNNVYQPLNLTLGLPAGLQPDEDDQRLAFYFESVMPDNDNFRAAGFYGTNGSSIPIYLPGEMDLIRAEAYARQNDLENAVDALNEVLTKQPGDDPFGIGAGLEEYDGPLTQEAILNAIYTNRATEFQLSGFRLEDSRRFGRRGPNDDNPERNRTFYPYPNSERDNNLNTPPNPTI